MSNETPRLQSGFPASPATVARRRMRGGDETPSKSSVASNSRLPQAPENAVSIFSTQPVIPLTVLDAPQQRLYAFGVYALLWAWKLYDWLDVVEDGSSSWFLFLKWLFIDFLFIFGVPELRIPWLELSQFMAISIFSGHLFANYLMMFNIPLPLQTVVLGLVKLLYDRELSISEQNVKVSNILNNHSLIMGKQIINILPEGSAVLNPQQLPFCLGGSSKSKASLPVYFNATVPAEIEFLRIDLDTNKPETIKVPSRDVNKIAKQIRDNAANPDTAGFQWEYLVKKPGVYRLSRVLDEYKLEVQRMAKDTYVVPCPQARFEQVPSAERCIRDLSDFSLEVTGTPPLRIGYARSVNGADEGSHTQNIQPEDFNSPLLGGSAGVITEYGYDSVSWAGPRKVTVALNESMITAGSWEYIVNDVEDAFGNKVQYRPSGDEAEKPQTSGLSQVFTVKERPKVRLQGCDLKNPLRVAKGQHAALPIDYGVAKDVSYQISYDFSPIDSLTSSGDHGDEVVTQTYSAKNNQHKPWVSDPGLYTIRSVSSSSCEGSVDEPSSCLLLNPLEPHLAIRSEEIPDKCAGNTIGLRVDLDLVGTPPFTIRYDVITQASTEKKSHFVEGLRSQLELIPKRAGKHKYVFRSISDDVYRNIPLAGEDKSLEQVVKPAASALIHTTESPIFACLDSKVEVDVLLYGDPPFNLEWEIVHDGKRKTFKANNVVETQYKIETASLVKGGDYILALSSVQDKRGCKTFLTDEVKISVRRQHPRGGFGLVEQRHSIQAVEGTNLRLPLRLQGEAPWTVTYRSLNGTGKTLTATAKNPNGDIPVSEAGIYEILSVKDKACSGNVDQPSSKFRVDWFPRPEISMAASKDVEFDGAKYIKPGVCEGDPSTFQVSLSGAPPYRVEYEVRHKPLQGAAGISRHKSDYRQENVIMNMETSKAGDYTYRFSALSDNLYDGDKNSVSLTLQQKVNPKPSASFGKTGQTFKYCKLEQEHEDKIPITLTGEAPFYVELEIKHQGGSTPEIYRIPTINSKTYGIELPREHVRLGSQQVRIRRVRDARGCEQRYETGAPSIHIHIFDAPSIYPLEERKDYCVGDRISYTLSGTPPFDVSYEFNGRWNAKSQTTSFRRIAEKPGEFTITSISDKASECRAPIRLPVTIHPLPSVQISQGRLSRVDIHEGSEVDMQFDFWGTPPFEFTYTRSTNAKKGLKTEILDTKHEISYEKRKVIKVNQEGTYEVVAIKDKYCSFSTQQVEIQKRKSGA